MTNEHVYIDILYSLNILDNTERDKIKNIAGYFIGILKRKNETSNAPPSSSSSIFIPYRELPTLPSDLLFNNGDDEYIPEYPRLFEKYDLTDIIQEKVEELAMKDRISVSVLEGEVIQEISILPESIALQVLRETLKKDPTEMRDPQRFILGMYKCSHIQCTLTIMSNFSHIMYTHIN